MRINPIKREQNADLAENFIIKQKLSYVMKAENSWINQ